MARKKRGLGGHGVDVLLSTPIKPTKESAAHAGVTELAIKLVDISPYQPRTHIDKEAINALVQSIKKQGVIQPVLVRKIGSRYELIAGERRLRAAIAAGLNQLPAIIKKANDEQAAILALTENIMRENLSPMEEAEAFDKMLKKFNLTHKSLANQLGRSREAVTNSLRLNDLNPKVKDLLRQRKLGMGHARALLSLSGEKQIALAKQIASQGLSVREAEALAQTSKQTKKSKAKVHTKDLNTLKLERELTQYLGSATKINHTRAGKGRLTISYNSLDELDGVLAKIRYKKDSTK